MHGRGSQASGAAVRWACPRGRLSPVTGAHGERSTRAGAPRRSSPHTGLNVARPCRLTERPRGLGRPLARPPGDHRDAPPQGWGGVGEGPRVPWPRRFPAQRGAGLLPGHFTAPPADTPRPALAGAPVRSVPRTAWGAKAACGAHGGTRGPLRRGRPCWRGVRGEAGSSRAAAHRQRVRRPHRHARRPGGRWIHGVPTPAGGMTAGRRRPPVSPPASRGSSSAPDA